MKHIVIDFEMQHGEMQLLQSAPNVYQTEIIEIGAVMLNDEFEFVSEFKSYVHPSYGKLSDNIAILTGIKDSDIRDAPLISEAVSSPKPLPSTPKHGIFPSPSVSYRNGCT